MKHVSAAGLLLLILSACSQGKTQNHEIYLHKKGLETPRAAHFQHCHGYGCRHISDVSLSAEDRRAIKAVFTPRPATPDKERMAVAQAIGVFETRVGEATGTDSDIRGTFRKLGPRQLDCVDESTNTTIYLSILQESGLLRFHEIEAPTTRLPVIDYWGRWPHQTAVIRETGSKTRYAVDSWFHDNGAPAEIIPLDKWKSGWKPSDKRDNL